MVDAVDFPVQTLKLRAPSFTIGHNSRPGQQATNGMRRSVGISGSAMRLSFTVFIDSVDAARAFRGFIMQMEADTRLVRIALPDPYGLDGPFALETASARAAWPDGVPYGNDEPHSSGYGHAVPTRTTQMTRSADVNDREIYIERVAAVQAGVYISIDDFIYGVAGAWSAGLGEQRLRLSPVLRKAEPYATVVDLAPTFIGFCTTELPGSEALEMGLWGEHSLSFTEDLTRLVEAVA